MSGEFQSLIGRLQTREKREREERKREFQSLIGRLQTRPSLGHISGKESFNPS